MDADERLSGLLTVWGDGQQAREQILALTYTQLRGVAERRMRKEGSDHTLQPTALVHEAWFRLSRNRNLGSEARSGFFRAASEAMRRVLVDHARKRNSAKRGSGRRAITASLEEVADFGESDTIVAIDEALRALENEEPRAAEVVRLRFFAGLSFREVAEMMKISERTAMREWSFSRARLYQILGDETAGPSGG